MPKDPVSGLLVPGRVSPGRSVPPSIDHPEYVGRPCPAPHTGGHKYNEKEIDRIRAAGAVAAGALEHLASFVQPGITTEQLDVIAHDYLVERGAYPSTLGYRGFPKSCCTSPNEVICHGIPDDTRLEEGDLLNIDITAYLDGMHGDTNRMYFVGDVAEADRLLVERTREALMRGIRAARPGRQVNVIGRVIERYAGRFGYGVVRDYTGHGVGRAFHTGLIIPHHDAPEHNTVIEPGMVFTIEPMLTMGGGHEWELWEDEWTVVTADRSRTAQWEHTIAIHEEGAEILTLP